MGLKYELSHAQIEVDKKGDASGVVHFTIRNDAGVGKLGEVKSDNTPFVLTLTQAQKNAIKAAAETAITDKYDGATKE